MGNVCIYRCVYFCLTYFQNECHFVCIFNYIHGICYVSCSTFLTFVGLPYFFFWVFDCLLFVLGFFWFFVCFISFSRVLLWSYWHALYWTCCVSVDTCEPYSAPLKTVNIFITSKGFLWLLLTPALALCHPVTSRRQKICFLSLEISLHFLEPYVNGIRWCILWCLTSFT